MYIIQLKVNKDVTLLSPDAVLICFYKMIHGYHDYIKIIVLLRTKQQIIRHPFNRVDDIPSTCGLF
jgi:hypothetical protein